MPIFGYLDDLVILPAGLAHAVRLIPRDLMDEFRSASGDGRLPGSRAVAVAIILIWLMVAADVLRWLYRA